MQELKTLYHHLHKIKSIQAPFGSLVTRSQKLDAPIFHFREDPVREMHRKAMHKIKVQQGGSVRKDLGTS